MDTELLAKAIVAPFGQQVSDECIRQHLANRMMLGEQLKVKEFGVRPAKRHQVTVAYWCTGDIVHVRSERRSFRICIISVAIVLSLGW